jgi:hypothetical protein
MLRRIIVILAVVVIAIGLVGCKKSSRPSAAPKPEGEVKTDAEYEAQAKKEINKDNMAGELDKIDREMQVEAIAEGL